MGQLFTEAERVEVVGPLAGRRVDAVDRVWDEA